mgnify:CR=1 FL=1
MWTHRRSGHNNQRNAMDHRAPYERDRTRVIHSPSFRRLQRKTQILGTHSGDFHRTRLTHSLEVASIGLSIIRNLGFKPQHQILEGLLPDDDLITTICLLHDIGHPPFGHGGETALNYMMREHGGFESNAQTLRLLTKLENSYGPFGLDLTRRSLLGILKYPVPRNQMLAPLVYHASKSKQRNVRINDWIPPKAYFDSEQPEIDWLLEGFSRDDRALFQSLRSTPNENLHGEAAYYSFDCSIMDAADDIAYGVHDLEDAIHLSLIQRDHLDNSEFRHHLQSTQLFDPAYKIIDQLFSDEMQQRKQAIGELVNYLVSSAEIVTVHQDFTNPILRYNLRLIDAANALLSDLKNCIFRYVIDSQSARTAEHGGQNIVIRIFEATSSNPTSLLDNISRHIYLKAENEAEAYRVICDYIANMTDEQASQLNKHFFGLL